MSSQLNTLFLGVTTSPARDFVAGVAARHSYDTYFLPCVGRFATLASMIGKGVPPEKVRASDVSLFSSLIGYLADPRKRYASLAVQLAPSLHPFVEGTRTSIEEAAGVLLAIKYAQLTPTNLYLASIRREVRSRLTHYRDHLRACLEKLLEKIRGLHYEMADVTDVIRQAQLAENSFLYVNLPGYRGGYDKMFAGLRQQITWSDPGFTEFDPASAKVTLAALTGASCTALAYVHHGKDSVPEGWHVLYAQPVGKNGRTDFIASNHPSTERHAAFSIPDKDPRRLPIYDDEEITPQTTVQFLPVDRDTCLYYRDLFVHRLGATDALRHYLLLLDGRVVTAVGLDDRFYLAGKSEYLYETFGITKTSRRYARLGKLFMLLLTSGDTKRFFLAKRQFGLRDLRGIRTSSPTKHHEGKTDRSVMKLVSREPLKNGDGFLLVYKADFREDTWRDCLEFWLKRWGDKRRNDDGGACAGLGPGLAGVEGPPG
jgi:hypothetical protein